MATHDTDDYGPGMGADAPEDPPAGNLDGGDSGDGNDALVDGIEGVVGVQRGRVISDTTRAAFKAIAAAGKAARARGEPMTALAPAIGMDTAAPADDEPDPAAAAPPEPAAAPPAPAPSATAEADAAWERAKAAEATALAASKDVEAYRDLPQRLLDDTVGTVKQMLRSVLGEQATDADIAEAIGDVITDLSLDGLQMELPADVRTKRDIRRMKRDLDKHKRGIASAEQERADAAAKAAKAQQVADVQRDLAREFTPLAEQFPFVAKSASGAGPLLFQVMEQTFGKEKRLLTVAEAAKIVDSKLRAEAQRIVDLYSPLLKPATATPATAKSAQSPDRSSVTRSPTLTARTGAEAPPVSHSTERPPDVNTFNNAGHRAASMKKLRAAFKPPSE